MEYYLCYKRDEYDRKFRRSNRKRPSEWQERGEKYLVRYPQTINDFLRESVYMCNCLWSYVDAIVENDTTVLFMRQSEHFNMPFITLEVYDGKLKQAYHRFNEPCSDHEKQWITDYCERHKIEIESFEVEPE